MRQLQFLHIVCLVEAISTVLLMFVAVPLKRLGDWPLGVKVMGPIHGLLFLLLVYLLVMAWGVDKKVPARVGWWLLVGAFVPVVGFFADRKLKPLVEAEKAGAETK